MQIHPIAAGVRRIFRSGDPRPPLMIHFCCDQNCDWERWQLELMSRVDAVEFRAPKTGVLQTGQSRIGGAGISLDQQLYRKLAHIPFSVA